MKKFIAIVLALVLAMSVCAVAFAEAKTKEADSDTVTVTMKKYVVTLETKNGLLVPDEKDEGAVVLSINAQKDYVTTVYISQKDGSESTVVLGEYGIDDQDISAEDIAAKVVEFMGTGDPAGASGEYIITVKSTKVTGADGNEYSGINYVTETTKAPIKVIIDKNDANDSDDNVPTEKTVDGLVTVSLTVDGGETTEVWPGDQYTVDGEIVTRKIVETLGGKVTITNVKLYEKRGAKDAECIKTGTTAETLDFEGTYDVTGTYQYWAVVNYTVTEG